MSEKKAKPSKSLQDRTDVEFLLARPEFRRWFLRVMETGGIDRITFQADPYVHAHAAGENSLGKRALQDLLNVDPRARLLLEQQRLADLATMDPEDDRQLPDKP